jgi:hypothetical protein
MVLSYNRVIPNHYLVILWPFPLIVFAFILTWFYQKFHVAYPIVFLVLLTFIFQVTSYYISPTQSWRVFDKKYELYKNLPDISEIGSRGYEPSITLPH